ncbi:uncharacterized protein LOC110227141 [Arabidopsis lyrata subsp. lyrata]|uniref:uncharacterized protein LOC110227141 n=1 Tax=Arabidopsis lyrata subsp. lyrata TaxID=81972 RepID=UPI000A29B4B7|nr:uncharacterized protein LOC110227141 [Arabidopsis lyrata subsp. lyrata]|eukprot:XP_020876144.1 uncharacterized protein LOC110227141 [Arabidopsis lyrata subsp. lyrata]
MGSRLFSSNGGQIQSPPPFAQRRRRRRPQKPFRSLWRLLLLSNPFSDPPNPVLLLFLRSSVVYLLPPFRSISVPKLGKTFKRRNGNYDSLRLRHEKHLRNKSTTFDYSMICEVLTVENQRLQIHEHLEGGGRSSARDTIGRVAPELWQENFEAICRN